MNFAVIGLTRLGIKPKSTAPEADAFTTPPSELVVKKIVDFPPIVIFHIFFSKSPRRVTRDQPGVPWWGAREIWPPLVLQKML